jgi:hypothetical protein
MMISQRMRIVPALACGMIVALSLFVLTSWIFFEGKVIELKDINATIELTPAEHPDHIRVKGLLISGVFVPKAFATDIKGRVLVITLKVVPWKPKTSNSFDVRIPIPDNVDEVRFGKRQSLLWRRE